MTDTPCAALGPWLVTVTVKTIWSPGVSVPLPSRSVKVKLLLSDRSDTGSMVLWSMAVLLPVFGSVMPAGGRTVARLVSVPALALGSSAPLTVYTTVPPTGRSSNALISLPVPLPGAAVAPPPTTDVKLTPVSDAGTLSVNDAPVTALGPALVTVTVYVTTPPG